MKTWWRADEELMKSWWKTDKELMKKWWRADEEVMKNWWRAGEELMKSWWRAFWSCLSSGSITFWMCTKSQNDGKITKTWILPVFSPLFLLKKRPSFARLFTKMSSSEELVTLLVLLLVCRENMRELLEYIRTRSIHGGGSVHCRHRQFWSWQNTGASFRIVGKQSLCPWTCS